MRPRSMTGFGRDEVVVKDRVWVAEVRTVNHRFLDVRILLPKGYSGMEERIRRLVGAYHDRGRVEVCIQQQGDGARSSLLWVNMDLAEQYYNCLSQINKGLDLGDTVKLSDMLTMRDLIGQQEMTPDLESEWEIISMALTGALDDCNTMREQEGNILKEDLLGRLATFTGHLDIIAEKLPELQASRQAELESRVRKLLDGVDLDPLRLSQEIAIMVDKCDVNEEMVRLRSHISQFDSFLESDKPAGRKMDFLLQEFLREVNTLSSKINNSDIAHLAVEMKNDIEKLREQVQNIE